VLIEKRKEDNLETLKPSGPNAQQIEYWNEQAGPRWVALQGFINPQVRPLGHKAMDKAGLAQGEHVLDVGCGCGDTTLELARRVGHEGIVNAVDISTVMLSRAEELARDEGLTNIRFLNSDAQTYDFEDRYDLIFSRFGVMFFAQPVEAFANLRKALKPEGRLTFLCWQALSENQWMLVPLMAALPHIPPPTPPEPGSPGPFSLADPKRIEGILQAAGFQDIELESLRQTVVVGEGYDLDQVTEFSMQMGPAAPALRTAPPATRQKVAAAIRDALAPHVSNGAIRLPAAAWIVSAARG